MAANPVHMQEATVEVLRVLIDELAKNGTINKEAFDKRLIQNGASLQKGPGQQAYDELIGGLID